MEKNYQIQSLPRIFEQIAKQLVEYIHTEELEIGSKLPTERKLSELLEVSRSSVREGIRVLELLKFLESKQGEGTFVSTPPPFLLPLHVLKQKATEEQLKNYFEIAMMVAEKITFISIDQNNHYEEPTDTTSFWESFDLLICSLGEQLENSSYLLLWKDSIQLLVDNDYFEDHKTEMGIQQWYDCYNQSEKGKLSQLFLQLLN